MINKAVDQTWFTYAAGQESRLEHDPVNDRGTNPYYRFFDLEAQSEVMDSDDTYNDDLNAKFLFEMGEGFDANRARTRSQVTFEDSIQDSWMLDELYCDSLSYCENADDQMIVLEDRHSILSWATAMLSSSPTARAMLFEAMDEGWSVSLESLEGTDYHLDVPEKLIVLDNNGLMLSALGRSEYFRNILLVGYIRALRDVWQEKRHGAFEDYNLESVLKLERIRAADLDVLAVSVAWELRGEGLNSLWRHMIGSEEGDIAMRFSGYMERDPSAVFSGKAMAEAFTQWFRSEDRINNADHGILNAMDFAVEEYGRGAFGTKKLTAVNLEILSCLPDKTAYLQGRGREVDVNPLYSGLSDEINQAHFMQISYDAKVVRVQDVPFRDAALAEKIFPGGEFTPANDDGHLA